MENLVKRIAHSKRTTPVKVYLWEKTNVPFPGCRELRDIDGKRMLLGDWEEISPILQKYQIKAYSVEVGCRNSAIPLLDLKSLNARIEPGAVIREGVTIGQNAVIMMGAVLNLGARVGTGTMIDMNAVLGGGAIVGDYCHIGAGAVLAGMVEPAGNTPVTVGDRVLVGANAVILEGIQIGNDAVVAAGAVVTQNVAPNMVVGGCPARFLKWKDKKTADKTGLTDGLR